MIDWLREQAATNDFFTGAVAATLVAGAMAYCKSLPSTAFFFIKKRVCSSITFTNSDPGFANFFKFLLNLKTFSKIKTLEAFPAGRFQLKEDEKDSSSPLIPTSGTYFGWYKMRPCILNISRTANENGGFTWSASFDIWFTNKGHVEEINKHIAKINFIDKNIIKIQTMDNYGSANESERVKKPISSIFLDDDYQLEILEDLKKSIERFDWMESKGITPKRVYLFHGEAGTGKTSIVFALASELGWSICKPNLTPENFESNWACIPKKSIILLDDIDTLPISTDRNKNKEEVGLGDLFSVLDGAATVSRSIVVLTTNHIDKLDKALIREGRVDLSCEIKKINLGTAARLAQFYLESSIENSRSFVLDKFGQCDKYSGPAVQEAAIKEKTK